MTEAELIAAAEALAMQKIVVEQYGMRNTPTDTRERVKLDAAYMLAKDKYVRLQQKYDAALRQWASEEK